MTFQDGGIGVPVNGSLTLTFFRNRKRFARRASSSSSLSSGGAGFDGACFGAGLGPGLAGCGLGLGTWTVFWPCPEDAAAGFAIGGAGCGRGAGGAG